MILKIALLPEEGTALLKLSQRERRDPRAQAGLIIRRALESAGLLETYPAEPAPANPPPAAEFVEVACDQSA